MKKVLLLFLSIITFSNCSKDQEIEVIPEIETIDGRWSVVKFYCGTCNNIDLNDGDIFWTFNLSENKLSIDNNISDIVIFEDGIYDLDTNIDIDTLNLPSWFDSTNHTFIDIYSDFYTDNWYYRFEDDKLFMIASGSESPTFE